jgi:hypothetical protein
VLCVLCRRGACFVLGFACQMPPTDQQHSSCALKTRQPTSRPPISPRRPSTPSSLTGTISEDIQDLSLLTNIYLESNRMTGSLPAGLFHLKRLTYGGAGLRGALFDRPWSGCWLFGSRVLAARERCLSDCTFSLCVSSHASTALLSPVYMGFNKFSGSLPANVG